MIARVWSMSLLVLWTGFLVMIVHKLLGIRLRPLVVHVGVLINLFTVTCWDFLVCFARDMPQLGSADPGADADANLWRNFPGEHAARSFISCGFDDLFCRIQQAILFRGAISVGLENLPDAHSRRRLFLHRASQVPQIGRQLRS